MGWYNGMAPHTKRSAMAFDAVIVLCVILFLALLAFAVI